MRAWLQQANGWGVGTWCSCCIKQGWSPKQYGTKNHSLTQARAVHDALLGCVIITHLPLLRLSMITSMRAPDCTTPCAYPDCKLQKCEGNRLCVDSTSPLQLRMKFPHHKNENKWKRAVIEFIVSPELAELLHMNVKPQYGGPAQTADRQAVGLRRLL